MNFNSLILNQSFPQNPALRVVIMSREQKLKFAQELFSYHAEGSFGATRKTAL